MSSDSGLRLRFWTLILKWVKTAALVHTGHSIVIAVSAVISWHSAKCSLSAMLLYTPIIAVLLRPHGTHPLVHTTPH